MTNLVAAKLRDPELIKKAKVYPYQLFTALMYVNETVPEVIVRALQDALDISLDNIPDLEGKRVFVFPDVSGSMKSPVSGQRGSATSKMRCVDVAALFAAALRRKGAEVWAVDTSLHRLDLPPKASVAQVAQKLASLGGGGTNLSLPLAELNRLKLGADLVVYFSDNESWADRYAGYYHSTGMMKEFEALKKRSPNTKLVCVDLQPYGTSQAQDNKDILKVGGFSDRVFDVVNDFLQGRNGKGYWVSVIENVEL
jgi:60 kDa SS-A/Ro ribonucleoprotein